MSYTSFGKMKAELARKPGVSDPGGLAASIARRKYGSRAVEHAAATGTSLRGKPSVHGARRKMLAGFAKRHG